MGNKRMIVSDLFEDEDIGVLDYFKRFLWVGMIASVADDQGRFIDNPAIIKAKVFPYDSTLSDKEVEKALDSFNGKIYRYEKNGKKLIQIVKWWKYQTPSWAAASKYQCPDGWIDRVKVHTVGNTVYTLNWDKVGGFVDSVLPTPVRTPVDSRLNDCDVKGEGDVKVESENEGEGEGEPEKTSPSPAFLSLSENQKLYVTITGIFPTAKQTEVIEHSISTLRKTNYFIEHPGELSDYLGEIFDEWVNSYNKNNVHYQASNPGWLDWALNKVVRWVEVNA